MTYNRDVKNKEGSLNWRAARGLFVLVAFLLLFSGFTLMRSFASTGELAPALNDEIVISVDSGDTLWELARTYKDPALDTRQAVHVLMERNRLSSPALQSGQELIFPANILP
ncbi:LysM peptidoglycan-binding domain-containing protein [Cohnella sp.]|uniref:LysM peptidoglycan-binding domain-containing protein n=1 Tax=Cohnella sp. TaxID=1883426 RepID=UPI0037048D4F